MSEVVRDVVAMASLVAFVVMLGVWSGTLTGAI